jgi:hypothetical protein
MRNTSQDENIVKTINNDLNLLMCQTYTSIHFIWHVVNLSNQSN